MKTLKIKKVTIKVITEDDVTMKRTIKSKDHGDIISNNVLKDKYLYILSELSNKYKNE